MSSQILRTAGLLFLSNCFMTAAWYGHLKFRHASLIAAILVSWLLALPEYALQVPANRLGYGLNQAGGRGLSAYQLKILQECITFLVFFIFAKVVMGEGMQLKYLGSFALILGAVALAFL